MCHYKPSVLDLFVEESCFIVKGFKMISYIDAHFNPSSAVDSLGIKQLADKSVVTLKACFLCLFASLRMGGITIDSALKVVSQAL